MHSVPIYRIFKEKGYNNRVVQSNKRRNRVDVCLSVQLCICVEKKNRLDVTECFIALIICSTCSDAHHQELTTICVLLPPMVCSVLVAGGRKSGARQQAVVREEGCCTTPVSLYLIS